MPAIEVLVTGKSIALAGGEGFDLLSLSVLNGQDYADPVVEAFLREVRTRGDAASRAGFRSKSVLDRIQC